MCPDSAKWEWSVQVIDDPKNVNAWCMAGGRMSVAMAGQAGVLAAGILSDRIGLELAARAGYDPHAAVAPGAHRVRVSQVPR